MPTFKYKFKNVFPSQMESNLCGLDMKIVILFSVNSSLCTHLFIPVFMYSSIYMLFHIFTKCLLLWILGIDLGAELKR